MRKYFKKAGIVVERYEYGGAVRCLTKEGKPSKTSSTDVGYSTDVVLSYKEAMEAAKHLWPFVGRNVAKLLREYVFISRAQASGLLIYKNELGKLVKIHLADQIDLISDTVIYTYERCKKESGTLVFPAIPGHPGRETLKVYSNLNSVTVVDGFILATKIEYPITPGRRANPIKVLTYFDSEGNIQKVRRFFDGIEI